MRALTLDYEQNKLVERDVPDPRLHSPRDVLFRVREVGICGTDRELAAFRFGYPPPGSPYMVLGHEAAGEVAAVGSDVRGIAPGDLVVPMVRRACVPACRMCAQGRRDLCVTGAYSERGIFGAHGYFSELAVDNADDLIVVPAASAEFAVLIEPLSVVEKAVELALRLHPAGPESALVIGAGAIGLLTAMALRARGLRVAVHSLGSPESPRARLVEEIGAAYVPSAEQKVDVVIEAAGSPDAAGIGLRSLAPLGVMVVLGAVTTSEGLPLLDLIVGNRIIAGSVNASPQAFCDAVADLERFPAPVLRSMIERTGFRQWHRSLEGPPAPTPKLVHSFD